MSGNSINDIDMDHFGSANNYLATSGLGPCIGFVALINNSKQIFIEHRSDTTLPKQITLNNTRSLFKNISQHISDDASGLKIMAVIILGGTTGESYIRLQKSINELIEIDINANENDTEGFYGDMLKNILFNNVCFNVFAEKPEVTGEADIDLIMVRRSEDDNDKIMIIQNVTKFTESDITIGVLTISLKDNARYFMIVKSIIGTLR